LFSLLLLLASNQLLLFLFEVLDFGLEFVDLFGEFPFLAVDLVCEVRLCAFLLLEDLLVLGQPLSFRELLQGLGLVEGLVHADEVDDREILVEDLVIKNVHGV